MNWRSLGLKLATARIVAHALLPSERVQAFLGGLAATSAMMALSKTAASPVMSDLTELAGTIAVPPESATAGVVGVSVQLVNGGLFAMGYRAAFDVLVLRPGWRAGVALGLLHAIAAGAMLSAVAPLHPRVPEAVAAPRAFMMRRGLRGAVTLVALHVFYGAIVGVVLASTRRPSRVVRSLQ